MKEDARPIPVPEPSAVSAPYWDATKSKTLTMQRCVKCRRLVWYPRFVCPHCGGDELAWEPLSGRGVVYAVSVHHRPALPAFADEVPYSVVLVDLVEGARIMSNVFGTPPEVGDEVGLAWVPLPDGRNLPTFERR
ncbi:putative nucleic-acid-binding protein containing a Zn-ribbon [Mycolicibacterium rhodesiae NBB3]|uniref:Putative nucleic-acid-binding protein containing a Zn-ribbon n=1 Tax=Mycolicibacterium rhodesiae (strain NBB3) TaxID=710685 RepID=G8RGM0_MYCRN|nr:OB-fold domain-containing protein [Mycolicibacterium rhodesiae]AEV70789.1 putative nucleic-acid-binding protein containing a Zn-ribbon [Mycolicibacterium rhodesiae NBB3]